MTDLAKSVIGQYCFLCSCRVIVLACFFGKMALVTAIMDEMSLLFSAMDISLLHVYGHYPEEKIEERINFAFRHVRLYLAESDDE